MKNHSVKKSFESVVKRRITIVFLFFLTALALLLGRLFFLQIVLHEEYKALAEKQHRITQDIFSERGTIFAQDKERRLIPLALNKTYKTLVASPKDIVNLEEASGFIINNLLLSEEEVGKKLLKANDAYEIIAKQLEEEVAKKLAKELPIGFFLEEDRKRIYPNGSLNAHLLGFVSKDETTDEGKYGLESRYDDKLSGEPGLAESKRGVASFFAALGRKIIQPSRNGSSLVLTTDYNISLKADEVLGGLVKKWKPSSGLVLVTEPKTGKIIAFSSYPTFDPNEYSKQEDFSVFLNPAIESSFELGSVLKPITMSAGIEEGRITPETTYEDTGAIKIGGFTIKNFDGRAHGIQTMTQVIEKSLNTGVIHVAKLIGQKKHREYLEKFGFGQKTGIDLPGEVSGNINNLKSEREIDFATASFGQGIAVTPMQLAMAIGTIANNGKLVKPYLVEKMIHDTGLIEDITHKDFKEVISKESAEKITKMLVSAVRSGFENKASVKGYFVAGKTGTAQIPRKGGRGYSENVIHTFVGYAPAFDPKFLVLLQLNEPTGNRFAANTLTPAFHDLAEYILNYYEIPPDEKNNP